MMTIKETILANPHVENAIDILASTNKAECSRYSKTIAIDNWRIAYENRREFVKALNELNEVQDQFTFEFSGDEFRPDLIITSRKLKATYDAIPKTKTMRDVLEKVYKDFGITTDIGFHVDLDEKITDEEYESQLKLYSAMSGIFQDKFEEDDSDDDL